MKLFSKSLSVAKTDVVDSEVYPSTCYEGHNISFSKDTYMFGTCSHGDITKRSQQINKDEPNSNGNGNEHIYERSNPTKLRMKFPYDFH
jgi:hypothetical protein